MSIDVLIKGITNGIITEDTLIKALDFKFDNGLITGVEYDNAINELGDLLEKAGRDISKLQKKIVVDKNGIRRQVWVKVGQGDEHIHKRVKQLHASGDKEGIHELFSKYGMSQGVKERLKSEGHHELVSYIQSNDLEHVNNEKHEQRQEMKQAELDAKIEARKNKLKPTKDPKGIASEPEKKKEITESENFKKWFGDSKVVNSSNEPAENYNLQPVKVYHGTAKGGFESFDKEKVGDYNLYGDGFYFTEDYDIAKDYSSKTDDVKVEPIKKINIPKDKRTDFLNGFADEKVRLTRNTNKDDILNSNESELFLKTGNVIDLYKKYNWSKDGYILHRTDLKILNTLGSKYNFNPNPEAEIKEVFLNIKNPIDLKTKVSNSDIKEVIEFAKKTMRKDSAKHFQTRGITPTKKQIEEEAADFYWKHIFDDFTVPDDSKTADPQYPYKNAELPTDFGEGMDVTVKNVKRMWAEIKKYPAKKDKAGYSRGFNIPVDSHGELTWESLHYILTDGGQSSTRKHPFTEYFKSKGYDGITHEGGWNIGSKPHKVWIAFEPTQIKATTAKEFDSTSPNIYKSINLVYKKLTNE